VSGLSYPIKMTIERMAVKDTTGVLLSAPVPVTVNISVRETDIFSSVPNPKLLIMELDHQIDKKEFRIRILKDGS